ncbi:hypothetical protein CEUSTIGMA_g8027.t1 [Chlamydomonas eustigma]|uniref:Carboxypeptidase Taq n=1 Tax=Chlamydomonas eustigma TaxID=1157962 RepID=A0A250XCV3_9CHLO|nr:hypothetical protein CEUSTIGMA_g8027.t1 [Chlamydomonas eustigma]|eukprot:GAX80590.1 hypothetical protein CEUSTIGMA_g8027.t1 [Chlamydomonas eustigma]
MAVSEQNVKETYDKLCEKLKDLSSLQGISGLLGWDEMVMMPSGAAASRGAQKAALAGVVYDKETDPELGQLLDTLRKEQKGLDEWASANIRDAHKSYVKATAIPKDLAQRIARHETDSYQAWVEARKASDFSKFAPYLQKWVDLSKEKAAFIDSTKPAYDVLLDNYEKGMTSARLDEIFVQVREGLVPLIAAIKSKIGTIDDAWVKGTYETEKQAELCKQVALDLGFNLENGRLDVSVHPFTGGTHPTDVRMTTRFKQDDLLDGLTAAVHETGHALYEQGRNLNYDGLPVNSSLSMGIHESQSLLWERMVALSLPFAKYLKPKLAAHFPEKFGGEVTAEELYKAENVVRDVSLIRVEADEVTYAMHIVLRYELERGLMDGSVKVEDLPRLWNEKMEKYLCCVPPNDAQGVLQDVHWSMGLFGYFPTYSLGAMYATQIYLRSKDAIPGLEEQIAEGEFKHLKAWLNENIHKVGSLHTSGDELMKAVTGSVLDPEVFLGYIRSKYTALYSL